MTAELGIVMLHHATDRVTRRNLAALRQQNPEAVVVTVSTGEALPGEHGYGRADLPEVVAAQAANPGPDWARRCAADVALCAWYRRRREDAARWLLMEWDGFCGMPAREWLREVWDFPLAGPSVRWPTREPEWTWWWQAKAFPAALQPFRVGIVPFCFILVSDAALAAVAAQLTPELSGVIGQELRFPTLANAAGFPPVAIPRADARITWLAHPEGTRLDRGMWHPIKWFVGEQSSGL